MIRQYSLISILIILLVGCVNDNQISQARITSEKLLNDISLGNTYDAIPEKCFSVNQTYMLMEMN